MPVHQMGSHFPRGMCTSAHASHRLLTLGPKICSLFALITIIVIEDELQFLRHRWQFSFGPTARFAPSCAGFDPFCIRFLLSGLVDGTEEGQQVVELVLGQ